MRTPRILVVAGSDSGGGAGIQADIKTITMLGGHAMTAVTAITAQNTLGMQRVMPVLTEMVLAQIDSVVGDIGVDAVKIGMLGSAETAHAVACVLEAMPVPVVFDPVMVATSGSVLADEATVLSFERLIALAAVTTPNLPELAALGGEARVRSLGRGALLVKGGHGEGDLLEDRLLEAGGAETVWTHRRLATPHTHGTGCTLASAIACGLGAGLSLGVATDRAVAFVQAGLAAAPGLGKGHGPMSHSLGLIPFHHLVTANGDGWDAAAHAARCSGA